MFFTGPGEFKKKILYEIKSPQILRATVVIEGNSFLLHENLFTVYTHPIDHGKLDINHTGKFLDEGIKVFFWNSKEYYIDLFRVMDTRIFTHSVREDEFNAEVEIEFSKDAMDILRTSF